MGQQRVDPQIGTLYGTYATNWTYCTCITVLDVWTWPRGDVSGLRLTDGRRSSKRGGLCHPCSMLNMI
jgi:hypothetical protein